MDAAHQAQPRAAERRQHRRAALLQDFVRGVERLQGHDSGLEHRAARQVRHHAQREVRVPSSLPRLQHQLVHVLRLRRRVSPGCGLAHRVLPPQRQHLLDRRRRALRPPRRRQPVAGRLLGAQHRGQLVEGRHLGGLKVVLPPAAAVLRHVAAPQLQPGRLRGRHLARLRGAARRGGAGARERSAWWHLTGARWRPDGTRSPGCRPPPPRPAAARAGRTANWARSGWGQQAHLRWRRLLPEASAVLAPQQRSILLIHSRGPRGAPLLFLFFGASQALAYRFCSSVILECVKGCKQAALRFAGCGRRGYPRSLFWPKHAIARESCAFAH